MSTQVTNTFSIEEITGKGQLKEFLELPHRLYANDPHWIAPLTIEQQQRFSAKNPFFQHARWRAWLARRNGRVIGRITAQVDELHLSQHKDSAGYFGMFEAEQDPEVVSALFSAAEDWLRGEGMQVIRGPFNLHINEEIGLLVDGFDTPPYVLMGHALPWYGAAIEDLGYAKAKDLLAYHINPDFEAPRVMRRLADKLSDRIRVRKANRKDLAAEAEVMRDIFNDAWHDNWGFVPLDKDEWQHTVETLIKLMPDDNIQIAELDGEPVAFIVALPNINEAARDLGGKLLPFGWAKLLWRLKVRTPRTARVPLMGVRRRFHHLRLGPTLAFSVIDAVRGPLHQRGVEDVEMGWILEDNDGMRNIIETIGGVAYKRYRVYEKSLRKD
ncbi:hypothetical protein [Haliea sp. E17]|uniref:hypothetical protein n=1 Tax=Haliea sp. E17 TaxID=3401576 RepID=UPI003AAA38E9